MDNRHNLSRDSAPWGNDVTRRTDSAVRSIDRLEQDFQQLTMQSSSALSRLTAGSGTLSQVLSYNLYDQEYLEFLGGVFLTPVEAPPGATSLTVRFNNYEHLSGESVNGGLLELQVSTFWGNYGPVWEVDPGGVPVVTVGRSTVTVPISSDDFWEWGVYLGVTYIPHVGSEPSPNYRHNVHLIWGF